MYRTEHLIFLTLNYLSSDRSLSGKMGT